MAQTADKQSPIDWRFCLNSDDTWHQMYSDCQTATATIDFEQFIFSNDEIGKQFAKMLEVKAREGIKVRLLCDTVGSFNLAYSETVKGLREAGVELLFFTPINPLRVNYLKWFYRDHKKILVVDKKVAYTGGVGIQKVFEGWRDTHVRISGEPIVSDILEHFEVMWEVAKKDIILPFPHRPQFAGGFRFVENVPYAGRKDLYYEVVDAIRFATKLVWITTPYFIPSVRLQRALRGAARRGIEIRLLLPLVSDSTWVNTASKYYFDSLLKRGVKIYQYRSKMIHSKCVIVDDDWATVGSMNLDNVSFHFNYEANLVSNDRRFVDDLKKHFLDDLEHSTRVDRRQWRKRPWTDKLLEKLTLPLHPVM